MKSKQSDAKAKDMFSLIEDWKQSGINQQQFCKSQGIAYSKFHYWYKLYRHQKPNGSGNADFKRIEITEAMESTGSGAWLVVHCTDGRQFSFHQPLPADLIRQLMH